MVGSDNSGSMRLVCDHIGIITHSLELSVQFFTAATTFSTRGEMIHDAHQGVHLCFLSEPARSFPRLELLQPDSIDSPVWRRMREGGGVHHLCFQIKTLDDYDGLLRRIGFTAVSKPAFAPAFGNGRRVAFVSGPGLGLLEFVETPGAPALEQIGNISARELKRSFLDVLR